MLRLGINQADHRGSTPLHWAIFSCSELAMVYILAWLTPEEIQSRDEEGFTAMHLAIKTSDKLQNTRAIRLLLYQGASTTIRDSSGNSALEIAYSLEPSNIK